jgi:hypothetical protein
MSSRLGPAACIALVFASCAPKRSELLLDTKAVDAQTLVSFAQKQQDRLQSIVGKGTVTFESPEFAGNAAFELSLKKPDSLLVTFEGPFGIDLGTLFVSREKYLVYNSMENRVITGIPSAKAIRSIIPFDLTLEQVIGAFSGSFPFPSDTQALQNYTIDDDMFLLMYRCGSGTCRYWIDAQYILVKKYEMRDEHNEVVMDAVVSSFAEDGAACAPKRVRIRFPSERRQLSVSYSSFTLNDSAPSFVYSIPSNARTIVR